MQGPTFASSIRSDLKAFEQRLMDCVAHVRGTAVKWKGGPHRTTATQFIALLSPVLIGITLLWFGVSLWIWWIDETNYVRTQLGPMVTNIL